MLLAAAMLAALPALAQRPAPLPPFYIGAGAGVGNLGISGPDLTGLPNAIVDDRDNTYTLRMGWRPSPYWALEAGYYDFGEYKFSGSVAGSTIISGDARAKSYGLSFVGILPIENFDLYARIGYAHSKLEATAGSPLVPTPANADDSQDEFTYGAGGRWNITPNWGLFAEWFKNDKIKVDGYVFGFDFRF
jgi:opacity protein-like surface antigen